MSEDWIRGFEVGFLIGSGMVIIVAALTAIVLHLIDRARGMREEPWPGRDTDDDSNVTYLGEPPPNRDHWRGGAPRKKRPF